MRDLAGPSGEVAEPDIARLLAEPARLNLVVQPIVDLRRAVVVGYEALSRFAIEPRMGPDRVFAAAARQGLAVELEARVIERAQELAARLPDDCFLSINVDPTHLTSERVLAAIGSRASSSGLVFELTEHRAIEDLAAVTRAVAFLKQRGALVAMDDAGAGYSGLKQILELRPQLLKLDRSLIVDLDGDGAKRALVQVIGELAGRLDAWLLAEGIETAGELCVLQQLGVPLGQGYFLARPGPPWPGLDATARSLLLGTPARTRSPAVAHRLLEACATRQPGEDWPGAGLAVRLAAGRPVAMRLGEAGLGAERAAHQLLRIKGESPLVEVGLRAVTRPEPLCWDPLVCVDERGDFLGVIHMPRLVSTLAELAREHVAGLS